MNTDYYIGNSKTMLSKAMRKMLLGKKLVFLCVGTDKVTGDCLGPLCGQLLTKKYNIPSYVYGSLNFPVHAKNIKEVCEFIKKNHEDSKVVAIDSSLGSSANIGLIHFGKGPVKTGEAMRGESFEAGDYFVTAVVNSGSQTNNSSLFSTRLKVVDEIANCIASAIAEAI